MTITAEVEPVWLTTGQCCDRLGIGAYSLHLLRRFGAAPRHRVIDGEFRWYRPDVIERATA